MSENETDDNDNTNNDDVADGDTTDDEEYPIIENLLGQYHFRGRVDPLGDWHIVTTKDDFMRYYNIGVLKIDPGVGGMEIDELLDALREGGVRNPRRELDLLLQEMYLDFL